MPKLILLRHFKSQWNLENRFTGWVDVPLGRGNEKEIKNVSSRFAKEKIDVVYTSPLIRNKTSVLRVFEERQEYPIFMHFEGKMKYWASFEELNKNYIPVYVSEALNERYYGKLQGLNKEKVMEKYGEEQVHLWRRSYKTAPPGGESLADVVKRTTPFFKKYIERDIKAGKNVLVVASHNSVRALIKYVENISDDDIINVEVPYGGLIEYAFVGGTYKKLGQ
jgi:2,3-bisphosphoglycerate-dependent phosphoglycerate mutase